MTYATPKFADDHEPGRASVRSERSRLVTTIEDLQAKLANAEARADYDPTFARLAHKYRGQLSEAKQRLADFDANQAALDKVRSGKPAADAQRAAKRAAAKFEKCLHELASAALALKQAGGELAAVQQCFDPGLWPSKQAIDIAVRARVIEVLGSAADIKLQGFGSSAKPAVPLSERFGSDG